MQTVDTTTTTRSQEPQQQPDFAPPLPAPAPGEKKSRKGLILGVLAAGGASASSASLRCWPWAP